MIFEDQEQMEKAMETEIVIKNPATPNLTGKKIKLIPTKWTIFSSLSSHCVCVKGLTKNVSENDLKEKFEDFGEVLKIELVTAVKGQDLKFPFSYIFFKQVEDASKVVVTKSLEINNVKVDVEAFQARQKGGSDEKPEPLEKQGPPVTIGECHKTLHISNAKKFVTCQQIEELMSKYGKVRKVLSQIQKSKGKPDAKFFKVVFEDKEGYANALKAKKLVLGKTTLHKNPIKWSSLPELMPHMVKVDGIPEKASKEDLEKALKSCGTIEHIELVKPKKRPTAVAFVFFKSVQSAKAAVKLDGTQLEGQALSINQRRSENKTADSTVFIKKPSSGDVTKDAVEKELTKFGTINRIHDGMKNYVITFKSKVDAAKALNMKVVKVAGVTLEMIGHQVESSNTSGVIVTGLAKKTTIDEVLEHFKECGNVVKKYINTSKRSSGALSAYAYLEFASQGEKTKALKLGRTKINGKLIFVNSSKPRA